MSWEKFNCSGANKGKLTPINLTLLMVVLDDAFCDMRVKYVSVAAE